VKFQNIFQFELFGSLRPALAMTTGDGQSPSTRGGYSLVGRGGNVMFSSGSGDDPGDEYNDEFQYDDSRSGARRAPGAQRSGSGGSGGGGANGGGGRQRSVQFQPEERYWTEYLRIALPIIGLLLMIGLFWYWASELAGNGNNGDDPVSTQPPGTVELIAQESTPEPSVQVTDQPTQEVSDPPASTPGQQVDPGEPVDPEFEESPVPDDQTAAGEYVVGDFVRVTEGLNMRSEGNLEGEIVQQLEADEILEIQGDPVEADGFTWYEVIVSDTSEAGWVAADFIEPTD
jgi:hypothetical protein